MKEFSEEMDRGSENDWRNSGKFAKNP